MVIALLCSALVIVVLVSLQWIRIRKIPNEFSLQPNCLLTHSPLLLLNGPQSLFYFGRYWNAAPVALKEHGYETYVWQPHAREALNRLEELESFLTIAYKQKKQFHLIADPANLSLLEKLAHQRHPAVASLNLVHATGVAVERQSRELRPADVAIVEWPMPTTPITTLARVQNWAHNRWIGHKKSVDLALLSTSPIKNWLEIAISLAETEMKCSHEQYGNTFDATHP